MSQLDALEALLGLAVITAGTALLSLPAAFIVAGFGLVVFALWPKPTVRR